MRVLAISGSLRSASSNAALLRAMGEVAPENVAFTLYEGLATIPPFNPDLDEAGMLPPAPVADLRRAVGSADALVVCSPEYAHGVPGVLKNALDWLVSGTEILEKPVALVTAARASFAQAQLAETLRTMSARLVPEAQVVVPRGATAEDEAVRALLRGSLQALLRHVVP